MYPIQSMIKMVARIYVTQMLVLFQVTRVLVWRIHNNIKQVIHMCKVVPTRITILILILVAWLDLHHTISQYQMMMMMMIKIVSRVNQI